MKNLEEYLETYFEVATYIGRQASMNGEDCCISRIAYTGGQGALYDLAKEWTDIFMREYKDVEWGETLEYYEVIETFLNDKNKE